MIRWPIRFQNQKLDLALIVDETTRVCYAYLLHGGELTADVWLYNRSPADSTPEWTRPDARSRMPFLNPPGFGRQDAPAIVDASQLECRWLDSAGGNAIGAALYVQSQLWARVRVGDRPGESIHAIKDGPLARRLPDTPKGGAA